MPRARLMLNEPAASAAPVPPAHTSACALPSATARAACTIEASGVVRAALTGSGLLAIETGASTISTPPCSSPSCAAGPNRITRAPCAAAIAAPAATSAGPRSAPLQSTATTGGCELSAGTGEDGCPRTPRPRYSSSCSCSWLCPAAPRPRGPRRSRTPDTPGGACADCGTAGTRSARAGRSCAARVAWRCGCGTAFSWGLPSRAEGYQPAGERALLPSFSSRSFAQRGSSGGALSWLGGPGGRAASFESRARRRSGTARRSPRGRAP